MKHTPNFALGKPASSEWSILERRYNLVRESTKQENWGNVLDIGCGNGSQTALFLKNCNQLTAIDLSPENVQLTKQLLPSAKVYEASAENLPFEDNSFDLILCFEVLEHISDDRKALLEMKRVLRKNGFVAITVPNKLWIFETHGCNFQGILSKIPWNRIPYFISWLPTTIHEKISRARIYSKKRIFKLVKSVGFQIEQHYFVTAPMDVIRWKWLQKMLRFLIFRKDRTRCPFLAVSHFLLLSIPEDND